jgi:integrase
MIEDAGEGSREITEVVFTAADITPSLSESKREKAAEALLNVLDGQIRNIHTRAAYKRAWKAFFEFCALYKLELERIKPYHFELWMKYNTGNTEAKRRPLATATLRQHLAGIRLLFDSLLEQGIVDLNPAARAKAPRLQRESSHTPVFEEEEIKAFMGSIKPDSLISIRDKALFSVLIYTWARVSAVVALRIEDYYERKGTRWLRLAEKRGKIHEVPVHSRAREAIDQWLTSSGLGDNPAAPLFPAFYGKNKLAETQNPKALRHMHPTSVWKLVQLRALASGIKKRVCCHSFRATGITEYMNRGGTLEVAQRIAGHSQLSTTKIYDRSQDRLTIEEIERVSFEPA